MAVLKFQDARATVLKRVRAGAVGLDREPLPLLQSQGRVLAEPVYADRDFPPFRRSTRDGFAVRSADLARLPVRLQLRGQIKAGGELTGTVGEMECVEIMTGAAVPEGADAVVMVEHTRLQNGLVEPGRSVSPGENVVPQASEAKQGDLLLSAGLRMGYAETAMAAAVGAETVTVYQKPRVAILPTGDEVVELGVSPGPFQIRNSNSYSLQVQVTAAHCIPVTLGIAPDQEGPLRKMIEEGLQADLLVLSGGVSMGKFDLVEKVLAELGAEVYFDGVAMQPGKPLVFGRAQGAFFFGLPGNPLSTMVTFELFVRPALALLSGEPSAPLVFLQARLERDLHRKPGLAAFLPAMLHGSTYEPVVSPVAWKGSGDMASLIRSNCYLSVPENVEEIPAGEWVSVLPR